jgi:HAD superfamily hydrolase (TIGR01509 family)
MGLRKIFAYHFASHLTGKLKPDRDAFEHVVTAMGCEPFEILYFDDQPMNVEAAQTFGIKAVCVKEVREIRQVLTNASVI